MKAFHNNEQALFLFIAHTKDTNNSFRKMNKAFRITGRDMKHWCEADQF